MKKKKQIIVPERLSVEILGRRELLVTGCTGIIHFSNEKIAVRAKNASVWVNGEGLTLSWAGDGRLMISGRINAVEFKGEE